MTVTNVVMWETQLSIIAWIYFKSEILLETMKTINQPLLCFGSRTFTPIIWMCKKDRRSVSHSSTESEIISLDYGLRIDGIPALDLWDVVRDVLHSSNNWTSSTQGAAGHCL